VLTLSISDDLFLRQNQKKVETLKGRVRLCKSDLSGLKKEALVFVSKSSEGGQFGQNGQP
jgi:hypothetical protein